jgi:hypothetical protein
MLISESYIIGVDISDGEDLPVITVAKSTGSKLTHVNVVIGDEAKDLYEKLTGMSVERVRKDGVI